VASKFVECKPNGLSHVGYNVKGLLQSKNKAEKKIATFKEAVQVIWGNLSQGPIDKAVKDLSK